MRRLDFRPTPACLAAHTLWAVEQACASGELAPIVRQRFAASCLADMVRGVSGPLCRTCHDEASHTELVMLETGFA